MKPIIIVIILIQLLFAGKQTSAQQRLTPKQDSILTLHLKNGAWKYHYYTKEYEQHIEEGLAADSTIAYLWQQKGMPYFKRQKYEVGMRSLDRAVFYDARWLDYRAFIKCIFVKNYSAALADFEICVRNNPNGYIMDHPYSFYMALCYLQLNQFEKAHTLLSNRIKTVENEKGAAWVHPNELFYLGIAQFELGEYATAIETLHKTLALYPQFSDAHYYIGKCYECIGQPDLADISFKEARIHFDKGFTLTEDNVKYEQYPYQLNGKMKNLR